MWGVASTHPARIIFFGQYIQVKGHNILQVPDTTDTTDTMNTSHCTAAYNNVTEIEPQEQCSIFYTIFFAQKTVNTSPCYPFSSGTLINLPKNDPLPISPQNSGIPTACTTPKRRRYKRCGRVFVPIRTGKGPRPSKPGCLRFS